MSTQVRPLSVASSSRLAERPWWQVGLLGGLLAAVLNLLVYAATVGVGDLSLRVENPQSGAMEDLSLLFVVLWSVLPGLLGAGLAAILARRSATPRRWFATIAAAVFLLSLIPTLAQPVPASTKVVLGLMHLVAAVAISLPVLARLPADTR